MKLLSLVFALCLLLPLRPLSAQNTDDALLILPDALFVLYFQDLPGFQEAWPESSLYQLFEEPSVQDFLAPSLDTDGEAPWAELVEIWEDYRLDDMFALYDDTLVFSMGFEEAMLAEEEDDDYLPPMLFAGTVSDADAFGEVMDDQLKVLQDDLEEPETDEITEDYLGTTLHIRRQRNEDEEWEIYDAWTILEGVALYGYPADVVREAAARLANPPADPAWPTGWKANQERIGYGDMFASIDLTPVADYFEDSFVNGFVRGAEGNASPEAARAAYRASGFADLQSVAMSWKLDAEKVQLAFAGNFAARRGIWKVLAFTDAPLPRPDFASPAYVRNSVWSFSFANAYDAILEMIGEGSPQMAQMLETQIATFQQQMGLDIRRELLGGLGDGIWLAETFRQKPAPGEELTPADLDTDLAFAFELRNRQSVETALNTVRNLGLAAFEQKEYLGTTIYHSKIQVPDPEGQGGWELSYALTDEWLLVGAGSSRALQRVITDLGDPGPSFWELPRVEEALADVSPQGFEFSEMDRIVRLILRMLREQSANLADEEGDNEVLDFESLPESEAILRHMKSIATRFFYDDRGFHTLIDLYGAEE